MFLYRVSCVGIRRRATKCDHIYRFVSSRSDEKMRDEEKTKTRERTRRPTANASPVPEDPLSRLFGIATLGANIAMNIANDAAKSAVSPSTSSKSSSWFLSETNTTLLANELCRLRGAALKVGQILSLQDEETIPEPLAEVLKKVRTHANVMPESQLRNCLERNLGDEWRDRFDAFENEPVAAASIGQVHRGVTRDGREVCVKVQYPGVARSIVADMNALEKLLVFGGIVPRGLFLDRIIRTAKEELAAECDYEAEASFQRRFRDLIHRTHRERFPDVVVPDVVDELSTSEVITMDWMNGVPIDETCELSQDVRNSIASRLLRLTVHELFEWHVVQSDPNWSNFLYDEATDKVVLLDFGASRSYPTEFMDEYFNLVWACANADEDEILRWSKRLGFLCGRESDQMVQAHLSMALVMGEPFRSDTPYDFKASNYQARLSEHAGTFTRERLMPPPTEVYTLHRKLFGTINACVKIGASIPCRGELEGAWSRRGGGMSKAECP